MDEIAKEDVILYFFHKFIDAGVVCDEADLDIISDIAMDLIIDLGLGEEIS